MKSYEWNLDALYKGYEDPAFHQDVAQLKECREKLHDFCQNQKNLDEEGMVLQGIELLEELHELSYRLHMYTILRQSVNTGDVETLSWLNKINRLNSECKSDQTIIEAAIARTTELDAILQGNEKLQSYSYLLHRMQRHASHALSEQEEGLLAKCNQTGKQAFQDMYYHVTAKTKATCLGREMTLTQIKNLCHDGHSEVRREAFLKEMECYEGIKEPLAFAVNHIKRQQKMEAQLRGYQDPLDQMLQGSGMKRETLDAMYGAVDRYLPKFHEYLRTKAAMLGYDDGLPWYEIYATIGKSTMTFSMEDCESYILKHFKRFSDDLYAMTKTAMDDHWIDYPSHAGKQSGAYCENLPWIKQSRILTNYSNTLSDVITVAHELGHAYHGMMVEDQLPLNREYCMPLAETASTFNENIMYHALIADADDQNKLFLIDTQLAALCQNICDIYTRYTFEDSVFDACEEQFLFAEDLQDLMLQAEKKCFGNGLDHSWLHPFRWITKVHYYMPDIPYYNFPYTFGALFSRGLYAIYEQDKDAFLPKYRALLKASTTHSVEETAAVAGIDLTKPEFWEGSLSSITKQMDEFLSLVKGNS